MIFFGQLTICFFDSRVIGPAVDIQTMKTEYRLVFGIYPPAGAKKMRASDCFRK